MAQWSQHKSPPRYREKDSRMPNWIELPVNHHTIIIIIITRPYAALRAAGLDWIVTLYYNLGWAF